MAVECFQSRFWAVFDWDDCSFISPSATENALPQTQKDSSPCCDHYFKDFANRMTSCRVAWASCVYCGSVLCVSACVNSRLAHLREVPEDGTIQKQKLINQPVPELAPLSLVTSFISSSLHPSIPPSLHPPSTPLRGGWGSSDAVTPGFPLSFCYSLSAESSFISHLFSQPFLIFRPDGTFMVKCFLSNFASTISIG